ncbi:protein of unknown function [Candidatus Filomicrobium marinum]|nr:protein of unknown function [Candidatus Filomicrobium marinum]
MIFFILSPTPFLRASTRQIFQSAEAAKPPQSLLTSPPKVLPQPHTPDYACLTDMRAKPMFPTRDELTFTTSSSDFEKGNDIPPDSVISDQFHPAIMFNPAGIYCRRHLECGSRDVSSMYGHAS